MALTRIQPPAVADVREPNFRNIVINGDMAVAQRATSATSITASGYHAIDRYSNDISSAGTWTISQDTDVPTGQGFANSLKMDCTTADSSLGAADYLTLNQKFEGQNLQYLKKGTSSAQSLTLSFWVKSVLTGTYCVNLIDQDNSREIDKSYTISSASTWEKKTITFAGDTTGTLDDDNAKSLEVLWWLGAGSNYTSGSLQTSWGSTVTANRAVGQVNLANSTSNNFWITGIQLEAGSVATDFEVVPYDQNLQRCYRYYEMMADGRQDADAIIALGFVYQTNVISLAYQWHPKRSTPSISQSSGTNYFRYQRDGGTEDFDSIKIYIPNANTGLIYSDDNFTGTDDENGWAQINNAAAYVALSAEL